MSDLSLSLSSAHERFILFSLSCPAVEGSDREALVQPASTQYTQSPTFSADIAEFTVIEYKDA